MVPAVTYFDYLSLTDQSVGIVVADVSGTRPRPLASWPRPAYLRPVAKRFEGTEVIVSRMHDLLAEDLGSERYITLLLVQLNPVSRTLTYTNAGHPPASCSTPRQHQGGAETIRASPWAAGHHSLHALRNR